MEKNKDKFIINLNFEFSYDTETSDHDFYRSQVIGDVIRWLKEELKEFGTFSSIGIKTKLKSIEINKKDK